MSLLPTGFEAQVESPARGKEAGCAMASNPGSGNASKKGRDFYAMLGVEKTANQVSNEAIGVIALCSRICCSK